MPDPRRRARFGPDRSLTLLREGYTFWETQRAAGRDDVVQARVLGRRAMCVRGAEGARFFYESPDLRRSGALPWPLVHTLFGAGAVHTLDGDQHRHRKSMFTGLLDHEAAAQVASDVGRAWDRRPAGVREDVFERAASILFDVGAVWLGVRPIAGRRMPRPRDMVRMVDGLGSPGPRHWRAYRARGRVERHVRALVREARRDGVAPTPLTRVALHRDEHGDLLPERTAAVEIVNLWRPLVAVSWLVAGLARALDDEPSLRDEVTSGSVTEVEIAQEVRRSTPFVPFLAARAARRTSVGDHVVPRGSLVVLDVWGTNHDPRWWDHPHVVDPTRYRRTPITPYTLVPQGGGDREAGHRCPGEDVTIAVLAALAPRLAREGWSTEADVGLRRMPPAPTCPVHRPQGGGAGGGG